MTCLIYLPSCSRSASPDTFYSKKVQKLRTNWCVLFILFTFFIKNSWMTWLYSHMMKKYVEFSIKLKYRIEYVYLKNFVLLFINNNIYEGNCLKNFQTILIFQLLTISRIFRLNLTKIRDYMRYVVHSIYGCNCGV